jgi:hypothetical protein
VRQERVFLQGLEVQTIGRRRNLPLHALVVVFDLLVMMQQNRLTDAGLVTFTAKSIATFSWQDVARKAGNLNTFPGKKNPACVARHAKSRSRHLLQLTNSKGSEPPL